MKNKNNSTTTTNAEYNGQFISKFLDIGSPKWFCGTCGKLIEGTIYCDGGFMVVNHGGGQCKECYLKSGHRECSCGAFLTDNMNFCYQCGKAKEE